MVWLLNRNRNRGSRKRPVIRLKISNSSSKNKKKIYLNISDLVDGDDDDNHVNDSNDKVYAIKLAAVFESLQKISHVEIQYPYLYDPRIGNKYTISLANTLYVNRTIQRLDLSNNNIKDDGAISLSAALLMNRTIEVLNLSHNFISEVGARAIGEALGMNTTLQKIDLVNNQLGDAGAVGIAHGLSMNSSLHELSLGTNKISDEGVKALAKVLENDITTLKTLSLKDNTFTNDGAKALADALVKNKSLTCIHLDTSCMGEEAILLFSHCLKTNYTLETFVPGYINCSSKGGKGEMSLADASFFYGGISIVINPRYSFHRSNRGGIYHNWKVCARKKDENGRLPLNVAIDAGVSWETGLKEIAMANSNATNELDHVSGMYSFMLAGAQVPNFYAFRNAYNLLRMNPGVLSNCCGNRE